jgi:hypothetical protein
MHFSLRLSFRVRDVLRRRHFSSIPACPAPGYTFSFLIIAGETQAADRRPTLWNASTLTPGHAQQAAGARMVIISVARPEPPPATTRHP